MCAGPSRPAARRGRPARPQPSTARLREHIPDGLRLALLPLVEAVGELTARIAQAGRAVERLGEAYPETRALRQVIGVGPITALTFVRTIEDPSRFPKNREVGAYLGLVPRQRDSGERTPQLRICQQRSESDPVQRSETDPPAASRSAADSRFVLTPSFRGSVRWRVR